MSSPVALIEATGLSKSYASRQGVRHVLRHVSLRVERGEFLSVIGAMGSGKSTLLGILAGLVTPDAGQVCIDGRPVQGIADRAAFVFQNYSLLPWLTALENVRLAVEAACPTLSRQQQRDRAREALEQVGLAGALGRRPSQLSGGMRQRVAIARAFATRPDLLFLDEPFGALDALTRETLQQELARLCSEAGREVTIVMITNNVDEAMLLSDRIVPMVPGPPATLGASIPVMLPRPRASATFGHDDEAAHTRTQIIAALAAMTGGRTRRATPANPLIAGHVALAPAEE